MSPSAHDPEILDLMEILLTAEVVNKCPDLKKSDLRPLFRKIFSQNGGGTDIKRPLLVNEGLIERSMGISNAYERMRSNPFVGYEEFGQRLGITTLEHAAEWFLKHGGREKVEHNPALAYFFEQSGLIEISYQKVREQSPRYEDSKQYLDTKVARLLGDSEEMRAARDLIILSAPEEVEYYYTSLVYSPLQKEILKKIATALHNRDFLRERGIFEFGKLLFVGPPGTGKTSLALAMACELHMPVLEVRLAMVTSQYLGETSKNIDRIFELARHLSPCILFIDEFDFVAKSRVTDDNAAMKRAVNMLLKNIDTVSFIKNGVLLIGATNHPWLLDEAAWRRFDEVVEFPLPDVAMRKEILQKITSHLDCTCDFEDLAERTEGFSGADLRIMVKEAVLSALMSESHQIDPDDIEKGMGVVKNRDQIRRNHIR